VSKVVHHGLALSLYLFSLVMDEITRDMQDEVHWYMLFADDIALIDRNLEEVNNKLKSVEQ